MPSNKNSVWHNGKEYKWSDKLGDYVYWVPVGGGRVAPQTYKDALNKKEAKARALEEQKAQEPAPTSSDAEFKNWLEDLSFLTKKRPQIYGAKKKTVESANAARDNFLTNWATERIEAAKKLQGAASAPLESSTTQELEKEEPLLRRGLAGYTTTILAAFGKLKGKTREDVFRITDAAVQKKAEESNSGYWDKNHLAKTFDYIKTAVDEYERSNATEPSPSVTSVDDPLRDKRAQEIGTDNKQKRPSMWLNGREYKWSDKYGDYIYWLVLGGGKVVPKFYSQDVKQQAEWDEATKKNGERQKPVAPDSQRVRVRPDAEVLPPTETLDEALKNVEKEKPSPALSSDPEENAAMQIGQEVEKTKDQNKQVADVVRGSLTGDNVIVDAIGFNEEDKQKNPSKEPKQDETTEAGIEWSNPEFKKYEQESADRNKKYLELERRALESAPAASKKAIQDTFRKVRINGVDITRDYPEYSLDKLPVINGRMRKAATRTRAALLSEVVAPMLFNVRGELTKLFGEDADVDKIFNTTAAAWLNQLDDASWWTKRGKREDRPQYEVVAEKLFGEGTPSLLDRIVGLYGVKDTQLEDFEITELEEYLKKKGVSEERSRLYANLLKRNKPNFKRYRKTLDELNDYPEIANGSGVDKKLATEAIYGFIRRLLHGGDPAYNRIKGKSNDSPLRRAERELDLIFERYPGGRTGRDVLMAVIRDYIYKHRNWEDWEGDDPDHESAEHYGEKFADKFAENIVERAIRLYGTRGNTEAEPSPALSSDPEENAAMQIGQEIEKKYPTEEERQAEEERLRRFEDDARTSDEWSADLGEATDESDLSALDETSANRLRREDATRRQFRTDAQEADEWDADLGEETDEELDSSALDKDAARKLRVSDQGRRRRRLAKEAKARALEEQKAQEPAPTSSDAAEAAAMQIGQEVEARAKEPEKKSETIAKPQKSAVKKAASTEPKLRGGKPKAWIADKEKPNNYDVAVVHNVKNNLYRGWSEVLERYASALESGDEEGAARLLAKARANALNIYRRAYSVHGDGKAVEILTGFDHGATPETSIRLSLNKKLDEWTKGKDVAAIRAKAARLLSQYAAPSASKSGIKPLSGAEGTTLEKGSGANARRFEPGVTPGRPRTPNFNERYAVKISDLNLDPKRFQFKLNTNDSGVTDELDGAAYNPDFAGEILVWRDPSDGKDYVVNGHHRFNLAKKSGWSGNVFVRYSRAKDAREAKVEGAVVNIADAKGTATDAADVIRNAPNAEEEFLKKGVAPTRSQFARGRVLARLEPNVFNALKTGLLTEQQAFVIGDVFPTKREDGTFDRQEDKQRSFFNSVRKRLGEYTEKGKGIPTAKFEDLALAYATTHGVDDPNRQAGGGGLFDMGYDYDAEVGAREKIIGAIRENLQVNKGIARQLAKVANVDAMKQKGVLTGEVDSLKASQERDAAARAVARFKDDLRRPKLNNVLRPFVEELTRSEGRKNTDAKSEIDKKRREILDGAVKAVEDYYNDPDGLFASSES